MRTHRSKRSSKPSKNGTTHRAGTPRGILLGALAAGSILVVVLAGALPLAAFTPAADQAQKAKTYKATRAFVVDKESGNVRMPTQQEVDEVVANLSALGQRPTETLQQTALPNGAVGLNVDGGFSGVLLARPNDDGTWETRCVFTLEEGAEFLGIVADDVSR